MIKMKTTWAAAAAAALACAGMPAQAADWHSAGIGYTMGNKYKEPGSDKSVEKSVITLSYVGGYKLGTNFFTLDMLTSETNNTARNSPRGAQEVYVVYNHTLSLGKLGAATKMGPIRDIGMQAGFDFNSKNDTFGAGLTKVIAGPKLEFDVPGMLTAGVFYYKENNNNSVAGKNVSFDGTYRLGMVWSFPMNLGVPAEFKGFANYTGEKGKDGFGGQTAAETWVDAALLFDVGSMAGKPKTFFAGPTYQYIKNKFGNQPTLAGTKVSAPGLTLRANF